MPPATITTSRPSASSTGQWLPNGPRTPSIVARLGARRSPRVAAPTARTVCTSRSGAAGSPLIEIGTSPGAERVQHVELARARTRARRPVERLELERPGVARLLAASGDAKALRHHRPCGARRGCSQAGSADAIDVEQPQPRRLQALDDHLREAPHQLVAELVVGLALAAQAGAVERDQRRVRPARGRRTPSGRAGTATTSRAGRRRAASRRHRVARRARASRAPPRRAGSRRRRRPARPRGTGTRPAVEARVASRSRRSARAARAPGPRTRGDLGDQRSIAFIARPPATPPARRCRSPGSRRPPR